MDDPIMFLAHVLFAIVNRRIYKALNSVGQY